MHIKLRSLAFNDARSNYLDAVRHATHPELFAAEIRVTAQDAPSEWARMYRLQIAAYWQSIADAQVRSAVKNSYG